MLLAKGAKTIVFEGVKPLLLSHSSPVKKDFSLMFGLVKPPSGGNFNDNSFSA